MKKILNKIQEKICAILKKTKLHISSFVGGQFKREQKHVQNNIIGRPAFRTIPMYSENAERSLKIMKERTMTYIIAGISNKKPFLMVDCVGTDKSSGERKFNYTKKLERLISTKEQTYFCLSGSDCYSFAISIFDRECYEKNKSFDFKNEEYMLEIIEIFKQIKEHRIKQGHEIKNFVRLYFVIKTDIYYYEIEDDGSLSNLQNIGINNSYIRPKLTQNSPTKLDKNFNNNQELISFCKEEILKVQDYNIDLKNKFSHIIFDEEEVLFDNSVKTNKELVLSLIGGSYDEL